MNKSSTLPRKTRVLIIIGVIVGVIGIVIGALCINVSVFRKNYFTQLPDKVDALNPTGNQPLRAVGRGIYDKNGNRVALNGIGFGNWFLQESFMTVNSIGAQLKKDGSFAKVNEQGIVEGYLETFQDEVIQIMNNNPNLTEQQVKDLWEIYYSNFIQEEDFANVKSFGLNTIRLPVYYRNFMEGVDDEHLVMRSDAFVRLDWFLEMCKKYGLYAIIDMHGVVGGQNGYEHSGTRDIDFWKNEIYQEEMCTLWKEIALHYKNDRPDLYETIAAYDLVNEPVDRNTPATTRKQIAVMDKMYQAIRQVDKDHIISIEFCWFFNVFPNPERYGWENVLYQIHLYNWTHEFISNDFFYWVQDLCHSVSAYDVPCLIGEFTFFNDEAEWIKWLNNYDERGWNWTIWNYKVVSPGWWDNSWGLYVRKLHLQDKEIKYKLDLSVATYDQIYAEWQLLGTSAGDYRADGILARVLNARMQQGK